MRTRNNPFRIGDHVKVHDAGSTWFGSITMLVDGGHCIVMNLFTRAESTRETRALEPIGSARRRLNASPAGNVSNEPKRRLSPYFGQVNP